MFMDILHALQENGTLSVDDLARRFDTDTESIQAAMECLEQIGYLSKTVSGDVASKACSGKCAGCAGCFGSNAPSVLWWSVSRKPTI